MSAKKLLLVGAMLFTITSIFAKPKQQEEFTVYIREFSLKEWVSIPDFELCNKDLKEIKDLWYWHFEEVPYVFDNIKFEEAKFTLPQLHEKCLEYCSKRITSEGKTKIKMLVTDLTKGKIKFLVFRRNGKVFAVYAK